TADATGTRSGAVATRRRTRAPATPRSSWSRSASSSPATRSSSPRPRRTSTPSRAPTARPSTSSSSSAPTCAASRASTSTPRPGPPARSCPASGSSFPRECRERLARQPARNPLLHQPRASALVEVDRRLVPVEHLPLHPPAALAYRLGGAGTEERLPRPTAPELRQHEDILEVKRGARQERRVREEVDRVADHRALDLGQQRPEARRRPG